jgi:hypothetical protein
MIRGEAQVNHPPSSFPPFQTSLSRRAFHNHFLSHKVFIIILWVHLCLIARRLQVFLAQTRHSSMPKALDAQGPTCHLRLSSSSSHSISWLDPVPRGFISAHPSYKILETVTQRPVISHPIATHSFDPSFRRRTDGFVEEAKVA